jgi:hypothetical protein
MITQDDLKELLHYDPETGIFTWRLNKKGGGASIGKSAGSINKSDGYRYIKISQTSYSSHRLAWYYHTGQWPIGQIDHINGNRTDNRIVNLRDVSCRDNHCNHEIHRKGRLPGCCRHRGKWYSYIKIDGKHKALGYYATEEEAHHAYILAKKGYVDCD